VYIILGVSSVLSSFGKSLDVFNCLNSIINHGRYTTKNDSKRMDGPSGPVVLRSFNFVYLFCRK